LSNGLNNSVSITTSMVDVADSQHRPRHFDQKRYRIPTAMTPLKSLYTFFVMFFISSVINAAPAAEYWSVWDQADQTNADTIDHQRWQDFLQKYLTTDQHGTNLVRYRAVAKDDKLILDQYIDELAGLDPRSYNRDVQMAYWLNLYNALTVQLILDNYPVDSIKDLGGFFKFGPWDDKIVEVAGMELTLNDIEHRILRPIWQDKRIHYGVNCASIGCPNLLQDAFTSEHLEQQLEQATKTFINQSKGLTFSDDVLQLSSIYDWYLVDFGSQNELLQHLSVYLEGEKQAKVREYKGKINYAYDWQLNEAL